MQRQLCCIFDSITCLAATLPMFSDVVARACWSNQVQSHGAPSSSSCCNTQVFVPVRVPAAASLQTQRPLALPHEGLPHPQPSAHTQKQDLLSVRTHTVCLSHTQISIMKQCSGCKVSCCFCVLSEACSAGRRSHATSRVYLKAEEKLAQTFSTNKQRDNFVCSSLSSKYKYKWQCNSWRKLTV